MILELELPAYGAVQCIECGNQGAWTRVVL